jgi:hypothetical protein
VGTGRDNVFFNGPLTGFGAAITATRGPNVSLVAGRNIAVGWGVIGVEVDARWSKEESSFSGSSFNNGGCCFSALGQGSYTYRNDAGLHASIRAGATFDDVFIFAKAGVGATRINEIFALDERNVRQCLTFDFSAGACLSFGPPGSLMATKVISWLPSAIFGLGIEKNWGSVFGRLDAEIEAFNHPAATLVFGQPISGNATSNHTTMNARGSAMIGVRF